MNGEKYIPNPSTPEEHLNNCMFQALNVKGWLSAGAPDNAVMKARCLLDAAKALVKSLEQPTAKE